jgi:hypothetical protein
VGEWFIGIDPGNKGALVALGPDDALIVRPGDRPARMGWRSDPDRYAALLSAIEAKGPNDRIRMVFLETQQARARQQGQAKINREQGMWEGWLMAHGLPYRMVLPRGANGWRKPLGRANFKKGEDPKAWTAQVVERLLPNLDARFGGKLRTYHDGVTDAAGMALAARISCRWE